MEVTRRIVASVSPQCVLLFGSTVSGKLCADSGLDILVIMLGVVHRRQTAQKIYRDLQDVGAPVNVVVVTEEDIANYGNMPGTILRPALHEGQVLYDAHRSCRSAELVSAQQEAEKALKAVCLHTGQDFPNIHINSRYPMITIQNSIDDALLLRVDQATHLKKNSLLTIHSNIPGYTLQQMAIRELEQKHAGGYPRQPVTEGEFCIWEAEQVW